MGTCCSVGQPAEKPLVLTAQFNDVIDSSKQLHAGIMCLVEMWEPQDKHTSRKRSSSYNDVIYTALSHWHASCSQELIRDMKVLSGYFRNYLRNPRLPAVQSDERNEFYIYTITNQVNGIIRLLGTLTDTKPFTDVKHCVSYVQIGGYISSIKQWTPEAIASVDGWFTHTNNTMSSAVSRLLLTESQHRVSKPVGTYWRVQK